MTEPLGGGETFYVCDFCGVRYKKAWTDEEALAEADDLWGEIPDDDRAIACDPCFQRVMSLTN